MFPQPLPIQELGSGSGCPLWGFWRARTTPFPHCRHSCRDLSPSCGRTGRTRVSRSSEQLEPIGVGPAQLPAPFPSPRGDKLGPLKWETPGLSPRRGGTTPLLPSAPAHSRLTAGDEGAAFPSLFPSLPPSLAVPIPCLCSSLPFPVPGWQTGAAPQPNSGCHRKMALLLLPVLPPPLRRQAVPECERKLLRR